MSAQNRMERDCVIAAGGPAGMVLGYLLARAGRRVTVLEKHGDFFRDFRGDTVHPSTVTLLGELGLREKFLELPLTRLSTVDAVIDGQRITMVDFRGLPAPDDFLVLAPQWDLLNFLAREAAAFPNFELRMLTEATGLLIEEDQVRGVRATTPDGELEIRAALTVAADGRTSVLRDAAGFVPEEFGVPSAGHPGRTRPGPGRRHLHGLGSGQALVRADQPARALASSGIHRDRRRCSRDVSDVRRRRQLRHPRRGRTRQRHCRPPRNRTRSR